MLQNTLESPQTARRSNQSILKEISPEYSLKGLMLKLNLQYFGCLMRRANSSEKTLKLGKIEGGRRKQAKNPKIGRSSQQTFLQGRYVDGQKAHEKMFDITNY